MLAIRSKIFLGSFMDPMRQSCREQQRLWVAVRILTCTNRQTLHVVSMSLNVAGTIVGATGARDVAPVPSVTWSRIKEWDWWITFLGWNQCSHYLFHCFNKVRGRQKRNQKPAQIYQILPVRTPPAHVAEWSAHSAVCSRAWRAQWPRFDSAWARPPTKQLFLIIPMHMINGELIQAGKRVQRCPL